MISYMVLAICIGNSIIILYEALLLFMYSNYEEWNHVKASKLVPSVP